MEEKQGWERPGYFMQGENLAVPKYDWYGNYGNKKHERNVYEEKLLGDCKYIVSDNHKLVSLSCSLYGVFVIIKFMDHIDWR